MEKIKWKYYKKFKQWYIPYGDFTIDTKPLYHFGKYVLTNGHFKTIGRFKKLSSAKKVAELLING